jgi:ribosome biogenesis protein MAK21
VYKNPKKTKQTGASAMQPAATVSDGTSVKLQKGEVRDIGGLMNDPALLKRRPEEVPVDQVDSF